MIATSKQSIGPSVSPPQFGYHWEKFAQARSALMLPHEQGEAVSLACAFEVISRCIRDFDNSSLESNLDDNARQWLATVRRTMDTTGIAADNPGEGTFLARARRLTAMEKHDFSRAVDELAAWFGWHNNH
jgi:hypothetical protein